MKSFGYKVPVTFKVDMTGVDVSNGVYVTGEFPNDQGEEWKLNSMKPEGDNIYSYTTEMEVGAAGAYYFLNDDDWGAREKVPAECIVHWGLDRGYEIPAESEGETFAYAWSSCEEIRPVSVADPALAASLFNVFPNPIQNDRLSLSANISDKVNLTILDFQGKRLLERELDFPAGGIQSIDLHPLGEGPYLLSMYFTEHHRYESKVIMISGN